MAPGAIDYERGVTIKRTRGMQVIAFKDEPGAWYFENGEACKDLEVVAAAGFDVKESLREKRRRSLRAEHEKAIEAQLAKEEGKIEDELDAEEAADDAADEEIVQAGTTLTAKHKGGGKYEVVVAVIINVGTGKCACC